MDYKEVELVENNTVKFFFREYFFLSNFYERDTEINEIVFKTNEHYFQTIKTANEKEKMEIMKAETPGIAKRLGKKCVMREDWEAIKLKVMKTGLMAKFSQHEDLKKRLFDTGNMVLEEGNDWNDRYWGVDLDGKGENMLGKLIMEIRDELRIN